MSARFGFSLSGNGARLRTTSKRAYKPFMSPQQLEAYLVARDALRRIQRASSAPPSDQAIDLVDGSTGRSRRTPDGQRAAGRPPSTGLQGPRVSNSH